MKLALRTICRTLAGILFASTASFAQTIDPDASVELSLWPALEGLAPYELMPDQGDGVIRITNIKCPTLAVYPAAAADKPAPAILICPGGGYAKLAYNKEGTEIAQWLNTLGIAAAVLKYRVPDDRNGALEDAQRAMGLLREHAEAWNIDPRRVGVLGFSAGGHLAARLGANSKKRAYEQVDAADDWSCRPDYTILIYPAYIAERSYDVAPEIPVNEGAPPAFIVQTQDDTHYINSSLAYYMALKGAGVPAELHLFPVGGHGYGLRPSEAAVSGWPSLCARWLETAGILR